MTNTTKWMLCALLCGALLPSWGPPAGPDPVVPEGAVQVVLERSGLQATYSRKKVKVRRGTLLIWPLDGGRAARVHLPDDCHWKILWVEAGQPVPPWDLNEQDQAPWSLR